MPSPDRERHDRYIRHFLETGEEHIIGIGRIMSGRRRDGSIFPMELSVGQTASGARPLFTAFIRDLIRNAGEFEHFSKPPPERYRDGAGRRIIGYYGAIADWFDVDLVRAVARDFPDRSEEHNLNSRH